MRLCTGVSVADGSLVLFAVPGIVVLVVELVFGTKWPWELAEITFSVVLGFIFGKHDTTTVTVAFCRRGGRTRRGCSRVDDRL